MNSLFAKCVLILFLSMVCGQPTPFSLSGKEEWHTFKNEYGKSYDTDIEDRLRMKIFLDNKKLIEKHNHLYANGIKPFKLGINKFADMTSLEYIKMTSGLEVQKRQYGDEYIPPANEELASTIDWTKRGAVTPVKDQGWCSACWAFSATGSMEGQHFLKTGKLVSLSAQNLIDCSVAEKNNGCEGGLMDQAFDYVKKSHGIDTEDSYKFTGQDDICHFNKTNVGATYAGYKDISSGDESALQSAVANIGPISVGIDASLPSFRFYASGVYYEEGCSSENLGHALLAVGYGSENGRDYWLLKNSWGTGWGLDGYIKMSRNRNNNCGIASMASYPLV